MWNIPSIPFVQSHTHTTSRSQGIIHQNPLEFITSSGLHYWFPVYPQLSAHVITPVIDFSKLDVIRRELMQTFTLLPSKIRAYSFLLSGERKSDCHSHNSFQGLSPQRHLMPAEVIRSGCNPFPGVNTSRHSFNVLQCLPLQWEFYSTWCQSIVKLLHTPFNDLSTFQRSDAMYAMSSVRYSIHALSLPCLRKFTT